jgi:hypothetical protein
VDLFPEDLGTSEEAETEVDLEDASPFLDEGVEVEE